MESVDKFIKKLNDLIGKDGKVAFAATLIIGLLTHMTALVSDIPNHDGLASMYFDQNMITSGRWFLGTACGISSFYSVPWVIGVLALIYLGLTAVILAKFFEMKSSVLICIMAGILVSFPSIASNFAYVFTMDGYMLGVLLTVFSAYIVDKHKYGFLLGGIALAFGMGIYQAYLPIAMLLCLYKALNCDKVKRALKYLYMGAIGVSLYYFILQVLLKVQGKELDTYQGIEGMADRGGLDILASVKSMYVDFVSFSIKGNVLFSNIFALIAIIGIVVAFFAALIYQAIKKHLIRKPCFYIIGVLVALIIPIIANIILVISPNVNYHLLMRYQWAFFFIIAIGYIDRVLDENNSLNTLAWITVICGTVLVFCYTLTDNVGYSNLQKKYEKTYAYCLRLADRIEQTEGYYQGIPIYMIGVVGDDNFPETDITQEVTDHMIGISGDWLLYTSKNYEQFYKYYMGISFNFLAPSEANYYDSSEYIELNSFPGENSTRVVDGVLYVKTENMH